MPAPPEHDEVEKVPLDEVEPLPPTAEKTW
jgi:hypothetical protein